MNTMKQIPTNLSPGEVYILETPIPEGVRLIVAVDIESVVYQLTRRSDRVFVVDELALISVDSLCSRIQDMTAQGDFYHLFPQ